MAKLQFTRLALEGVTEIKRARQNDSRGSFDRLFCNDEMHAAGLAFDVVQTNLSFSALAGTIRGVHFQRPPSYEAKIVTCIQGSVFDVAVDLRLNSPTFGQWTGVLLDGNELNSLVVPEGFGHGFQTVSDDVKMVYFHSGAYDNSVEGGVDPFDADIGIDWPVATTDMSQRDMSLPSLKDLEPIA
jgi:dTDP-4-dehydrorhamnose 3,5-epimerase